MKTREKLKKIYTVEDSDEEEEIVISDSDDDFKPATPKIPNSKIPVAQQPGLKTDPKCSHDE